MQSRLMSKDLLLLFFICLLASCDREDPPVDTPDASIYMAVTTTVNGDHYYFEFRHDAEGRIVHIVNHTNIGGSQASVAYNGNEILITGDPVVLPNINRSYTIKCILDQNKNPTQRIRTEILRYFSPANHQNTYIADTTNYEYDANGILTKSVNTYRDSTWNLPGTALTVTKMDLKKITFVYTNINGNLSSGNGTGTRFIRTFDGAITNETTTVLKKSIAMDYTSNYPNKTDFINTFILNEFKVIFSPLSIQSPVYLLNMVHKNIPNRIDHNHAEESTNGNTIQTIGGREEFIATYNNNGFLSSLKNSGGNNSVIDLRYIRW